MKNESILEKITQARANAPQAVPECRHAVISPPHSVVTESM